MACAYWTERMARDTDAAHKAHQQALKEQALRRFMQGAGGNTKKHLFHATHHA